MHVNGCVCMHMFACVCGGPKLTADVCPNCFLFIEDLAEPRAHYAYLIQLRGLIIDIEVIFIPFPSWKQSFIDSCSAVCMY